MKKKHITLYIISILTVVPVFLVVLNLAISEPGLFNPWAGGLDGLKTWKFFLSAAFASVVIPINALVGIIRSFWHNRKESKNIEKSFIFHHILSIMAIAPLFVITLFYAINYPDFFNPHSGDNFFRIMIPVAFTSFVVPLIASYGIFRRRFFFIIFILFLSLFIYVKNYKKPIPKICLEKKQELIQYLKENWKSPEDYVISKFSDYDIVFIGELHRIKHDVELIQNLIPRLYKAGIYNLGMEFGNYEDQNEVDLLITADEYDENLARKIMFKSGHYWGMKEYIDIYKKAWELNKSLDEGAPKFRVVNLDYRANWKAKQKNMTRELWQKVWYKGSSDEHMASIILKEFVKKKQKALIYSGSHHAFTRYYQPSYNFKEKKLIRLNKDRMGNIVYHKIPDKVFNIVLHYPWQSIDSGKNYNYPIKGAIDNVMKSFQDKRVGFDVKGTPFGYLKDDSTYYSLGYTNFTLSAFCDGYIFQKHFSDYEGCTVDKLFITEENLQEAIDYSANLKARERRDKITPDSLINSMIKDANMKKRFRRFE